ncbi:hypothetical protein B296_00031648 [Ensete ventricosum]|uniref:Uncharacterized protein n=1 Tax=Ensete ventricosum TaxID=4639 RepID=A0A427ADD1_ENSVE|nr:hypothetical protein B296_00031648 [Ensete ventricosum]
MKSPLRLFRGLKLGRQEAQEEKQQHRPPMNMDKLIQATQVIVILLFFEAYLRVEKSGDFFCRALMMMGKAQFALQKFFDVYRLDILRTMDKPSRSLLREFEVVEVCFL